MVADEVRLMSQRIATKNAERMRRVDSALDVLMSCAAGRGRVDGAGALVVGMKPRDACAIERYRPGLRKRLARAARAFWRWFTSPTFTL